MIRRAPLAFVALVITLLGASTARAYCRRSTCTIAGKSVAGTVCTPQQPGDCGTVLQWRQPCMSFALQRDGSSQVPLAEVDRVVNQAFAAWMAVDCGAGEHPSIGEVADFGEVSCGRVEYNQHGGNANVIVFREDVWPHADESNGSADTIALTTVTYDFVKGDIFDADMEINAVENKFTTTDTQVDVDLLSVITHEAGHFFGLAHSADASATMFASYSNGSIELRTLEPDDQAAICNAYPPGRTTTGLCDDLPRHGFAAECADAQTEGHCALAPGQKGLSPTALFPALALLALARRRARSPATGRSR